MEEVELLDQKIIFCFPYKKGPGGVSLLFLRLAIFLDKIGYDVSIVDYIDGEMSNNCPSFLSLIEYHDDKTVVLPPNSIVILQSMTPWSIFPCLAIPNNNKVFFITTLAHNFFPLLPGKFRNIMAKGEFFAKIIWMSLLSPDYNKVKRFISILDMKDAVVFLDDHILYNMQKSLNINIKKPKFIPLFSEESTDNFYLTNHIIDDNVIKIGWIGRIADFKINILNKVINDAFDYSDSHKQKIIFYIVGDGEYSEYLKTYESRYFSIERVKYIKPNKLSEYFLRLDMAFVMGTTALDSSRVGVPTVRLDYSFSKIPNDYLYKMFYEISGFRLGENIDGGYYKKGQHSFRALVDLLKNDSEKLSRKCFNHYNSYFSIDNSAKIFLKFIENSSLNYGELKKAKLLNSTFYSIWKVLRRNFLRS
jgi:hypothetical protein